MAGVRAGPALTARPVTYEVIEGGGRSATMPSGTGDAPAAVGGHARGTRPTWCAACMTGGTAVDSAPRSAGSAPPAPGQACHTARPAGRRVDAMTDQSYRLQ